MKRALISAALVFVAARGCASFGAPLRFEKLSEHCYYLQLRGGAENVGAVVTGEGTLIIDPPPEPDLTTALEALKRVSTQAVRWAVFTDPHLAQTAAARRFAETATVFLGTEQLRTMSNAVGPEGSEPAAAKREDKAGHSAEQPSPAWFVFGHQMHLFPSGVEIRVFSLQHKAHTGADLVVLVPEEKVLFVGGLYEAARYPEIDTALDGNPLEWIDGVKQVLESTPVLKPAIPQSKPRPKTEKETLEEGIVVVSAHGDSSNLQNMKDLLEACQKLRNELLRGIKAGRSCDEFLASPASDPYRSYGNLEPYAQQLFEALSATR
jgi:glyoxylase-like metal-dependent hydrolase (beta-lactamase superfamily II)